MFLDSYKEFSLAEKVKVKKETIHSFLMTQLIGGGMMSQMPVIEYVLQQQNLLTIAEIEYNPNLIIETYFSFHECEGQLHYGQFQKCFPTFFMFDPTDFKD